MRDTPALQLLVPGHPGQQQLVLAVKHSDSRGSTARSSSSYNPAAGAFAKSKEAQKRQREGEVFILNPQGPLTTHTIPKPFDLHDTRKQASWTAHLLRSPYKSS